MKWINDHRTNDFALAAAADSLRLIRSCVGASAVVVVLGACGDDVVCGEGTFRVGGQCVARPGSPGPTMTTAPRDAGGTSSSPEPDAGAPGYTVGPTTGPPGCDSAECDLWEAEITSGIGERQRAGGCAALLTEDARIDGVAERHAGYQAEIDRLDPTSPDGSLFDQVEAAGVRYRSTAALFASTRTGSADVLARWDASPDTAAYFDRCDAIAGVGVATASGGTSYVTVLLAVE